jgi:hypothetical protein
LCTPNSELKAEIGQSSNTANASQPNEPVPSPVVKTAVADAKTPNLRDTDVKADSKDPKTPDKVDVKGKATDVKADSCDKVDEPKISLLSFRISEKAETPTRNTSRPTLVTASDEHEPKVKKNKRITEDTQ